MNQLSLLEEANFIGQSNIEVEEIVLSTFINFPDTYYLVSDEVSIKDFTRSETRFIYRAIVDVSKNSAIDIVTISDALINKKYVDLVHSENGTNLISYLEEICDRVDTDKNIKQHIKILNEYNQKREIFVLSREMNEACNESQSTTEILQMMSQKMLSIEQMNDVKDFDVKSSIEDAIKDISSKKQTGIKTFIKELDGFLYQFDLNNLVIIAGAPSMGKTAFALEIFKNAFMKGGYKPLIFSLEMSVIELTKRMLSSESCIEIRKLRDRKLDALDKKDLKKTADSFKEKTYFIDDKSRKLGRIINQIRKHVLRHKTKLVIIDYLQLITYKSKSGSREQEIATISRALKEAASELGIVVIALSQLNRQVSQRTNKRPVLSDLRESGAIEQDADIVIFPFRPAYYQMGEKQIPQLEDDVEIIIAKGRSVGVGVVKVNYISKYVKFVSDLKENEKIQVLVHSSYSVKEDKPRQKSSGHSDQSFLELGQDQPF